MNSKDQHMSHLRFPHSKILLRLILPTFLALIFSSSFLGQSAPASAKPHFSIPGLHALQRKLGLTKRRKRTRRRKKQLKNAVPAIAAPLVLEDKNPLATPPLPARNPRRHVKNTPSPKNQKRLKKTLVKWKRTAPRQVQPMKQAQPKKQAQPTKKTLMRMPKQAMENTPIITVSLPPLPLRKPRRHPSKVAEPDWTPALIQDAVAQCLTLGIELKPLAPVRKGRCGNPAPVLLAQIDTTTIRPAATLSCPMAANLQRWFEQSVQPLAQKHFGKKVAKIRNVSSYVCRNRYGDTKTRISEHAYANALDIASFELQGGEKITVLDDWANPEGNKSAFLHDLHTSACKLFGTVLGPDANAAHKDHFHLDKAPRKRSNYCR